MGQPDRPEDLPELIKRFEGGADIVVSERVPTPAWPGPARLLRRIAPIVTRPFVDVPGITDPFGTLRVYRISVIRDLLAIHRRHRTIGVKTLVGHQKMK